MANFKGGARLTKQWSSTSFASNGFSGNGTALLGQLGFTEAQTILRMLGEINIMATTAPAAFDACSIALGIGLVSTDAASLGSTAMPDPADEPDFPWLFWKSVGMRWNSTTIQDTDGSGYLRIPYDIRSMRKVKPRESLVIVAQYDDRGGNPPVNVTSEITRVLVGIH